MSTNIIQIARRGARAQTSQHRSVVARAVTRRDLGFAGVSCMVTVVLSGVLGGSVGAAQAQEVIMAPQGDVPPIPVQRPIRKVFVAGATGQTGRRIVLELRAQGYDVVAGCRDEQKGLSLGLGRDPKVSVVQADVTSSPETIAEVIRGCDAIICATGFRPLDSKNSSTKVDLEGTLHLVEAAKMVDIDRFVLVTSLLTNGRALGQEKNPNFSFLNSGFFGAILDKKHEAEEYLVASGLNYTIVRPGGLSNEATGTLGAVRFFPADALLGLDSEPGREISRDDVAAVCVEALENSRADKKTVEIVDVAGEAPLEKRQWF